MMWMTTMMTKLLSSHLYHSYFAEEISMHVPFGMLEVSPVLVWKLDLSDERRFSPSKSVETAGHSFGAVAAVEERLSLIHI